MIQILGLRDYQCTKENRLKKTEKFFENNWRANSVKDLFDNLETYIDQIPETERYNMFYTVASCVEQRGRHIEYQTVIPIDIDDIDLEQIDLYVKVVIDCLGLKLEETGVVATGNGLHFLIGTNTRIEYEEYFNEHKVYYKSLCGNIANALFTAGLTGNVDTSVFSKGRILRLPLTKNIKPNKGEKDATLIQRNIVHIDFDLVERSGIPVLDADDQMHGDLLKRLPPPDTEGVLNGCDYIKWCGENQDQVSEPQWYAMLSIVARLGDGMELAKAYSQGHPDYNEQHVISKAQQAIESSGPRTCSNINTLWEGCGGCKNYDKCTSPISLQSNEFIKTSVTGFYEMALDKDGGAKRGKPSYDDLMKQFEQDHDFICTEEGRMLYVHTGTHWEDYSALKIESYAEQMFDPTPNNTMCQEFKSKLQRNNIRSIKWFNVENKLNMSNGVLDMETLSLSHHTDGEGFRYVLPFAYDPDATCPVFDTILHKITLGDEQMKLLLLEYMAYSISGMDAGIGQKALILTGEGSNGKSVFLDILKHLVGGDNYCTLSMGTEINKLENRYQLEGKLFNISEETPNNAMVEGSIFKALVTGGEVQARKLYCDSYSMKNNAKIIMACNELPPTADSTHGMFRRLLIVPFEAVFSKHDRDYDPLIKQKAFKEAAGIFNKVISVLPALRDRGFFSESEAVDETVADYMSDNDDVSTWWVDSVVPDTTGEVPASILYSLYQSHCLTSGMRPKTSTIFRKRMNKIVPVEKRLRRRVNGLRQVVYKGYRMAEERDDD